MDRAAAGPPRRGRADGNGRAGGAAGGARRVGARRADAARAAWTTGDAGVGRAGGATRTGWGRGRDRSGVSRLTARAYGFLGAGVALWLAGLLTGVQELHMLAVGALALPAGAWLVVRLGRRRLAAARLARPLRVPQGGRVGVTVEVVNLGRVESGVLLVADQVPYQLGPPARFVLPGVPGGDRERLRYELTGLARGRFALGPLSVRLSDPFDLAEVTSELVGQTELIVHPKVEGLPQPPFGGEITNAMSARVRRLYQSGEEYYTTREYHDGDDLRKVHWRSSAKRGALMIRQDENPWQARAVLLADLRRYAHSGTDEQGSFERLISAVASVAVRLAASGYELRYVLDDGRQVQAPHGGDIGATAMLDFLATVTATRTPSLAPVASRLARAGDGGLLVAVLTVPTAEEAAALARCRLAYPKALALLVRAESWSGLGPRDLAEADARAAGAATLLGRAGWRTATLERGQGLKEPWLRLTRVGERWRAVGPSSRSRAKAGG